MEEKPIKQIRITFDDKTQQINLEITNVNNFEFALAVMNMQALLMKNLMGTMNVGTKASGKPEDDVMYR